MSPNPTLRLIATATRTLSIALCIIFSLCISRSTVIASPFDDAFDSFDDAPQAKTHKRAKRLQDAPRCLTPLDRTQLDPNRARLRRKSDDMYGELNKQITIYFLDAETGDGVRGADVTLLGARGRTDRAGRVCFDYPRGDLMDTKIKAQFTRRGYASIDAELSFMAGALFFNRFTVTKSLPPGKLRVVLDWDAQPTDLDAHLIRQGTYHISYREMVSYLDKAKLDRDDRDGFGPETITINRLDPEANYQFFVHDYTRSGRLAKSKAHVRVYTERGLLKTFTVPLQQQGDKWLVFRLERGQIR